MPVTGRKSTYLECSGFQSHFFRSITGVTLENPTLQQTNASSDAPYIEDFYFNFIIFQNKTTHFHCIAKLADAGYACYIFENA